MDNIPGPVSLRQGTMGASAPSANRATTIFHSCTRSALRAHCVERVDRVDRVDRVERVERRYTHRYTEPFITMATIDIIVVIGMQLRLV